MKAIIVVCMFIIFAVVWAVKRSQGRRRVNEIDQGKRCIACDSTMTEVVDGFVHCRRCGHVVNLSDLQSAQVSEAEVAALTRPD